MFFFQFSRVNLSSRTAELRQIFFSSSFLSPQTISGINATPIATMQKVGFDYVVIYNSIFLDLTFVRTCRFWAPPVDRENSVMTDVSTINPVYCLQYFRHNVLLEIVQKSFIFFPVSARITSKR